jgi:hypothetical protein
MIAGAILGLIGVGSLTAIQIAAQQAAQTRARTYAALESRAVIDRIAALSQVVSGAGSLLRSTAEANTMFCSLLTAPDGPLDRLGGIPVGVCPELVTHGMRIPGSSLKRDVTIDAEPLGGVAGYIVTVRVSGGQLPSPGYVELTSMIRR